MKYKVSISVDEETIIKVREQMRKHRFKNKSQVYQHAIKSLAQKELLREAQKTKQEEILVVQ